MQFTWWIPCKNFACSKVKIRKIFQGECFLETSYNGLIYLWDNCKKYIYLQDPVKCNDLARFFQGLDFSQPVNYISVTYQVIVWKMHMLLEKQRVRINFYDFFWKT